MNIGCDINMQASITEMLKPKWTTAIAVWASAWHRSLDFYDLISPFGSVILFESE